MRCGCVCLRVCAVRGGGGRGRGEEGGWSAAKIGGIGVGDG